jgi:DtxR family Mn-dependent transcriptional regulator
MPVMTRSKQDYLKALYALAPNGETVPTSALATRLEVSPPSVTNMLGRLAAERLVAHTPRAGARLTANGQRRAIDMVRRHRILESFLVKVLGFDWSEVHEDAEVLEHHVSDRVLRAMDRVAGHPQEDPHGHPIPDRRGRVRRRALRPLTSLGAGESARVCEIHDAHAGRMARWKDVGLVPGARVLVCAVRALDDLYEIEIEGERSVMGGQALEGVMVERRGSRR